MVRGLVCLTQEPFLTIPDSFMHCWKITLPPKSPEMTSNPKWPRTNKLTSPQPPTQVVLLVNQMRHQSFFDIHSDWYIWVFFQDVYRVVPEIMRVRYVVYDGHVYIGIHWKYINTYLWLCDSAWNISSSCKIDLQMFHGWTSQIPWNIWTYITVYCFTDIFRTCWSVLVNFVKLNISSYESIKIIIDCCVHGKQWFGNNSWHVRDLRVTL